MKEAKSDEPTAPNFPRHSALVPAWQVVDQFRSKDGRRLKKIVRTVSFEHRNLTVVAERLTDLGVERLHTVLVHRLTRDPAEYTMKNLSLSIFGSDDQNSQTKTRSTLEYLGSVLPNSETFSWREYLLPARTKRSVAASTQSSPPAESFYQPKIAASEVTISSRAAYAGEMLGRHLARLFIAQDQAELTNLSMTARDEELVKAGAFPVEEIGLIHGTNDKAGSKRMDKSEFVKRFRSPVEWNYFVVVCATRGLLALSQPDARPLHPRDVSAIGYLQQHSDSRVWQFLNQFYSHLEVPAFETLPTIIEAMQQLVARTLVERRIIENYRQSNSETAAEDDQYLKIPH